MRLRILALLLALALPARAQVSGTPFSNLPELTTPASNDGLPIYDNNGSGVYTVKRITFANISLNITPAWANITGKPTTLTGYGITDAQPLDADLTALATNAGTVNLSGLTLTLPADVTRLGSTINLADGETVGINTIAKGGTGTATPALVEGANIQITGTWPNQTIAVTGIGGGAINIGHILVVDAVNGDDGTGTPGRLDLPYATIEEAVSEFTAGDLIRVLPGGYTVNENIVTNNGRIHCEPGVTITTDTDLASPFQPTGAVDFQLTGHARLVWSPVADESNVLPEAYYITNIDTGSDFVIEADRLTLTSPSGYGLSVGAVAPRLIGIYDGVPGKKITLKIREIVSSGGTDILDSESAPYVKPGNVGIWWSGGELHADIGAFRMTDTNAIAIEIPGGSETGANLFVTSDLVDSPIGVKAGTLDTDVVASWLNLRVLDCTTAIDFSGQTKVYVESQKIIGRIAFNAAENGLLYIRSMKTESAAADAAGSILGVTGSGDGVLDADLGEINVLHSGASLLFAGTGTAILRGHMRGISNSHGLNASGGTINIEQMRIDTSANSSTSAVIASGGTVNVHGATLRSHASGYDLNRSGGTVNVTDGSGSDTGGRYRTNGTIAYVGNDQPGDADLDDLADGSLTGSKVGTGINGDNITSGTVTDARIASTLTRDSEWDTAAEINAATTDTNFLTAANNLSDVASAATSRTNLGATATGANIFTVTNPAAETFLRVNADNSVSLRIASEVRSDLGLTALATTTPGTGVATALAINIGSAGAPVLFNGALGTPSSGTVTNLTGTASININGTVGATTPAAGAFTTLSLTGAITFPDGVKQTFNPDATNAGINVGSLSGDPSSPANGDLWYDSGSNELSARINGATVALGAGGGGGSPGGSNTQIQFNNSGSFGGSSELTWDGSELRIDGDIRTAAAFNNKLIVDRTDTTSYARFMWFTGGSEKWDFGSRGVGTEDLYMTEGGGERVRFVSGGGFRVSSGALIFDPISTPTLPANTSGVFGMDDSGTVRLYGKDEGGSAVQLTAHPTDAPPELYDETPGIEEFSKTINTYRRDVVWVNRDRVATFAGMTDAEKALIPAEKRRTAPLRETFDAYEARTGHSLDSHPPEIDREEWIDAGPQGRWELVQTSHVLKREEERTSAATKRDTELPKLAAARAKATKAEEIAELDAQKAALEKLPEPLTAKPAPAFILQKQ